ncbi:unnamed protein product [Menidia menidia]|uniref:(Atlantic silverside) hypothetical protein n=1 Tax=Menidia menidia TaxID=238744 RepID=A0A8S4BLK2_9TELE|nr:unnamed protein product [Menidia menidia]
MVMGTRGRPSALEVIRVLAVFLSLFPSASLQCKILKCNAEFWASTSSPGPEEEYCAAVRAYTSCVRRTARTCRGDLTYHSAQHGIEDLMNQHNCSKEGPTSQPRPRTPLPPPPPVLTDSQERSDGPEVCHYERSLPRHTAPPNYTHCGFFGDPHLRTFGDDFQTCKVEGAWPLIHNKYLSVQVTNSPVVPGSLATATSKTPEAPGCPPGAALTMAHWCPVKPSSESPDQSPLISPRVDGRVLACRHPPEQSPAGFTGRFFSAMNGSRAEGHTSDASPFQAVCFQMTPNRCVLSVLPQLTIIFKNFQECVDQKMYHAETDELPAAFADGSKNGGERYGANALRVVEKVPGQHVEIQAKYIGTTIVVRQVGRYLTFAVRMPEEVVNSVEEGDDQDLYLCLHGCPANQRIDFRNVRGGAAEAHGAGRPRGGAAAAHAFTYQSAKAKCKERLPVEDLYFQSCVFDLLSSGDINFTMAAYYAFEDVKMLHSNSKRYHLFESDALSSGARRGGGLLAAALAASLWMGRCAAL